MDKYAGKGCQAVVVCVRVRACMYVRACVRGPAWVAYAPVCACAHLRLALRRVKETLRAPQELRSDAAPGSFWDCFISGQVFLQQKPKGQTLVQSPDVLLPPLRLLWGH